MRLVRLRAAGGELEAAFAPEAGLVGSSLTHRGEELLSQRRSLEEYAERGSTFGIPFLHPWANRLADFGYAVAGQEVRLDRESPLLRIEEHGLPIHGLAPHGLQWEVEEEGGDSLRARAEFGGERLAGFPYPHRLTVEVSIDDAGLTIQTTLTAAAAVPVPIAFGYHPYLQLPGVPRAEWEITLPVGDRLMLDERLVPTGERAPAGDLDGPLGARTFDDGFTLDTVRGPFVLAGGGRRIEVAFESGYPYAQVFAPDISDVICFEPMTAPADALRHSPAAVAPGESFSARFSVFVSPTA
jgi:aldose 1-epimerase